MKKTFTVIVSAAMLAAAGCGTGKPDFSASAEKEEIGKVIETSIGWAMNKDKDALFNSMSQDSTFFIFHPDSFSTVVGFDDFRGMVENLFMSEDFRATGFRIKDLRINLSGCGETAWFSALLDDYGEWKGEPTGWDNARWTGVLEKKEGRWVIVQMHFSLSSR